MKRLIIFSMVFLFVVSGVFAQSKVAVLDASLGEGVHPNAAAIVADTINEQFVKSSDYIAIDRAYISSIQAEKQFQLSGEVADQDIKELGATFGADYLCIANVSLLGSTYTVSARLIEVSSAQVVAQESHRLQGEIDVLFTIAEVVGSKFVGSDLASQPVTQPAEGPKTAEPAPAAPAPKPEKEKWKPKNRVSFGYLFPAYMGDTGNDTYSGDNYTSFYEQDIYALDMGYDDAWNTSWGVDVHILVPLSFLYFSISTGYSNHSMTAEFYDYELYDTSIYSYEIFSTLDVAAGAGAIYSPFSHFQLFAGIKAGYLMFLLGSNYADDATAAYWTDAGATAGGLLIGAEAGADFFLGNICASLKYTFSRSADLTGDDTFTDEYQDDFNGDTSFGVHGFTIGAGYSW